jgi:hypothetical protein
MWELEKGEDDEKEGSKRERRERVLRATLRARMRVEQRRKWDRTRNKLDGRCFGGDGEGERGIKRGESNKPIGMRVPIALGNLLTALSILSLVECLVSITFFSLVCFSSGTNPRPSPNWGRAQSRCSNLRALAFLLGFHRVGENYFSLYFILWDQLAIAWLEGWRFSTSPSSNSLNNSPDASEPNRLPLSPPETHRLQPVDRPAD